MTELAAGEVLGGYRLEHLIGVGGMGSVFLATELALGRPVALKVIRPDLAADERFRRRFLLESRLAAQLDHPGAVPVYAAGEGWFGGREHLTQEAGSPVMLLGLIGTGMIGGTLARLAVDRGHEVLLANSRGPASLTDLVAELGPLASAGTPEQAAAAGDLVVVTIPLRAYREVPVEPLAGTVVIDTMNYYPDRDGRFPELDDGSTTSSELLAAHLADARVVKAFNTIFFRDLASQGLPSGSPGRRALPIAGDDPGAKREVAALIDGFGFDVVDAGPLPEGRRFQPGTPAYNVRLDREGLRQALDTP